MQAAYVAVKYMSMVMMARREGSKGRKAGRQEGKNGTICRVVSYLKAEV
jgi:hypothetical protein